MLIADILHSCANERVALAALASIGGPFADAFREAARERGVAPGALAVDLVRRFAAEASERDWRTVMAAIGTADLPVLCGLRVILARMLDRAPAGSALASRQAAGRANRQPAAQPSLGLAAAS